MKRVLITGAAGFIGSQLIEKFNSQNYHVAAWDKNEIIKSDTKAVKVNLGSEKEIISALHIFTPDIVVHCAGSADVGKSVLYPEADYDGNVTLTHNLLFALHKMGLDKVRFVFLSSASVYGNPVSLPIKENMTLNPLSPYAIHKVMCEDLCKYFAKNYGMDIKIARIFSAYGVGLKKQIFWDMYSKLNLTGKLEMFGSGSESRDYIHVSDVIQSLYLLATAESNEIIFNVANGEEITIRQAVELFAICVGINREKIEFNGIVREGDPLNWEADISRIKELGYKKSIEMKQGLQEYVAWIEKAKE